MIKLKQYYLKNGIDKLKEVTQRYPIPTSEFVGRVLNSERQGLIKRISSSKIKDEVVRMTFYISPGTVAEINLNKNYSINLIGTKKQINKSVPILTKLLNEEEIIPFN